MTDLSFLVPLIKSAWKVVEFKFTHSQRIIVLFS